MPYAGLAALVILIALAALFSNLFGGNEAQAAERVQAQRAEDASNRFGCAGAFVIVTIIAIVMIAAAGGLS